MAKALVNNSNGPRAVNTTKGTVVLQPGETLGDDFEVSDNDRAAIDASRILEANSGTGIEPASPDYTAQVLNNMGAGGPGGAAAMGTEKSGPAGAETAETLEQGNSKAQLLEIASTEGADANDGMTKADIAAAIMANRAK